MRALSTVIWIVVGVLAAVTPASADKRIALVIGNSDYKTIGRLPNPANDAAAVAALLKSSGFATVDMRLDVGLRDMRRAIGAFAEQARDADQALVYYAGHGMEMDGVTYLVPVDAVLEKDVDVRYESFSLDDVLKILEPVKQLRLVVLDACRDNPFARSIKRTTRGASIGRGLATPDPSTDTLVAYAAKAGTVANDGDGRNSPFTTALLRHLATPGLDVRFAFGRVREDVLKATGNKQEPVVYGALGGSTVALVPGTAPAAAVVAPPAPDPAAAAWAAVKDSRSIAELEAFVRRFGDSFFADLGRLRIDELKRNQVAVVAPPVAPSAPCGGVTAVSASRAAAPLSAGEECALRPLAEFRECADCPAMVVLPAGSFTMGSPDKEQGRDKDEGPQHQVNFAKPFAVGKLEVTVDQFAAFAKASGYDAGSGCFAYVKDKWENGPGRSWRSPGFPQVGLQPAACIRHGDAQAYVAWLSKTTHKTYRLLSEAEWEYAARAGTTTRFSFGDSDSAICSYANGLDAAAKRGITTAGPNWAFMSCDDGHAYTAPAGSLKPNRFGLHDMAGNMWEWVEDCSKTSYEDAPTDGSAMTAGGCANRVLRGGSWLLDGSSLRVAKRNWVQPDKRYVDNGFRVARTIAAP